MSSIRTISDIRRFGAAILAAAALSGSASATGAENDGLLDDLGSLLRGVTAGMTETGAVALVEASRLQAYLPPALPGLRRTDAAARQEQVLAVRVSKAVGRYENREGGFAVIEIVDWGSGARAAWTRMGFDTERSREGPGGFDRSGSVMGWPAVERYHRTEQAGNFFVRVADRFIVSVAVERLPEGALREGLRAVDLRRLAELAP